MSRKSIIQPYTLFSNESMATSLLSQETDVGPVDSVCYAIQFTGSPVGVFSVEASVDGNSWVALLFGSSITASGAADSHVITLQQCPFKKTRLRYTRTSGTGALSAQITAKSLGA